MFVLPIKNGAGLFQLGNDVGVVGRDEVLEHFASASCRNALGAKHVLDCNGNAGKRTEPFTPLAFRVNGGACSSEELSST